MVTVSRNIPLRVIEPRPERVAVCLFVFLNTRHRETNVTGTTPVPFHDFFFVVRNFSPFYTIIYIQKRFKGSFVGAVLAAAETLRF